MSRRPIAFGQQWRRLCHAFTYVFLIAAGASLYSGGVYTKELFCASMAWGLIALFKDRV